MGRVERERRFYETKGDRFSRERAFIELTLKGSRRENDLHQLYDPSGKAALDFGCGHGEFSVDLVRRGAASVVGIDISERMLEAARARVGKEGLTNVSFVEADGHSTRFLDETFDLIVGRAVLHHMDLAPALAEVRRLLKRGGVAYFAEPLWHNPILRLGRALTPHGRTRDEHPLTEQDWDLCGQIFPAFRHEEREFLTLLLTPARPLLPRDIVNRIDRRVARADDWLLRSRIAPFIAKYCRVTLLTLPKGGTTR